VWDMRKGTAIMDMKNHEDYISDITVDQNKKMLLTASVIPLSDVQCDCWVHSGDGTMGVFNLKRRRFELVSEYQSGDLTSVALMKRGKKVVCGSSEGTIYIFNWNGFGATSDRFALKAESVDCIAPITESIMCTASMDGYIRLVGLFLAKFCLMMSQLTRRFRSSLTWRPCLLSEPSTFFPTGSLDASGSTSANPSRRSPSPGIPASWSAVPMTSSSSSGTFLVYQN
ncbi:WD domain repeat-containing protein 55, partial [Xenoophorus captivus]